MYLLTNQSSYFLFSFFLDSIDEISFIFVQNYIKQLNRYEENVVIYQTNMSSERRLSDLRNLVSGLYTLGKLFFLKKKTSYIFILQK